MSQRTTFSLVPAIALFASPLLANPYPDASQIPLDAPGLDRAMAESTEYVGDDAPPLASPQLAEKGVEIVRVEVGWDEASDTYSFTSAVLERSGTPALVARSGKASPLGSFQGSLKDAQGNLVGNDAIGIGQYYRRLSRAFTFRFPVPKGVSTFTFRAENPTTGAMDPVLTQELDPSKLPRSKAELLSVEVKELRKATVSPALVVNIYADGYLASRRDQFWKDANKLVKALADRGFPGLAQFEIRAVFAPSKEALGKAQNLGKPVPDRDSFLSLYYPYWGFNEGRWYNCVYPTSEAHMRDGLGALPYDYPIALIDSSEYWGVGNFNEITAVPSSHPSFSFLLAHELGHFFGLNEEYDSGGTELAFAPGTKEPWSQNITFNPDRKTLKWRSFVKDSTPVPTPKEKWTSAKSPVYGAYAGGYGGGGVTDKAGDSHSHKPGFECTMDRGNDFCAICKQAISDKINFDAGSK